MTPQRRAPVWIISVFFGVVALAALAALSLAKTIPSHIVRLPDVEAANGSGTYLPNGWRVTPAGNPISLSGDMPLTIMPVTAHGHEYLAVNTAGYHDHCLDAIDVASGKVVQSVNLGSDWLGLCQDPTTSDIYVSSGGDVKPKFAEDAAGAGASPDQIAYYTAPIIHLSITSKGLGVQPGIQIAGLDPKKKFIAGLAAGSDGSLYAANIQTDTVYKLSGSDKTQQSSAPVGRRPYAVALSPDGQILAVSNWADGTVSLLSTSPFQETSRVKVGSHPDALAWGKDGRLFVTNSGSNNVSVIQAAAVVETIGTSLTPNALVGSTPDALALSPDGKRLYVANADNNDVAVIDITNAKESRVLGFIPTGWYPSAVAVSADSKTIYIGTGKGLDFGPNAKPDTHVKSPEELSSYQYIGSMLSGDISMVGVPDDKQLAAYTKQVVANTPSPKVADADPGQIQENVFSKIKHVVYIIRENRTYDEVFGDIKEGNGDSKLTLFGQNVTPNAHQLAANYVLLDNLYCNGEVSESGHQWCDASYVTDYTERAWTLNYGGHKELDDDDGLGASPAGYIWDNCAKHGLTYKSYAEASDYKATPDAPPVFQGAKGLEGQHSSPEYGAMPWFGGGRDLRRAQIFIDDLHKGEQSGNWPDFMVMSLPEDHTQGLDAGAYTPTANVGENDQALGLIVEAISHSKFWSSTAVFVIEDDAQNGPDHVDAHRTVGLVISPYVKRNAVDSTMYSTASFVHTMELILRLPPMTQYDAAATPLYNSFTPEPDMVAYNNLSPLVDLEAKNPKTGPGAVASAKLDLSAPDRCDPDALNHILWNALKPGVPMPAPVRSAALVR
ncbi:MAG TPA: bifunctional YncE family protein/alkaline phosphatase family protein [Capsulimonadaceae bacterium]|nr:bifunctional YncE family protein/alkaline phosphatase family protein [Capsulimonadaceae bacterium]